MKKPKIVLLGSIPKGDDIRRTWHDWKPEFVSAIRAAVPDAVCLDGDAISDAAGPEAVVGHDLSLVKNADVVVVNAATKVGAGTAQEMVMAKFWQKPVVSVIPPDTHHRKSNVAFHGETIKDWVHPFLLISSDFVASSVVDAADWVARFVRNPSACSVKTIDVFTDCVERFEQR